MRLIALVEAPDHVCCRYRLSAFTHALAAAGHTLELRAVPRSLWGRTFWSADLAQADAVILQRKLLPTWQLALLRRRVRRLLFDFDDAVWLRDSYSPHGTDHPGRLARFRATVQLADAVIAGNAFLAQQAERYTSAPVTIIPTCVEPHIYPLARHEHVGPVRLAWIGSRSTLQGISAMRELFDAIGAAVPNVALRLICDRTVELGRLPVEFVPWQAATETQQLAEADIGINWLPDDAWSRGKCGLKVLQYFAAGLPVVANPVGVVGEWLRTGSTGLAASSPSAWVDAISTLARTPTLRRQMGASGRKLAETRFSVAHGANLWLSVLEQLAPPARPGAIHWHLAPEHARQLLATQSPGPVGEADWLNAHQAAIVKQGPHRVVCAVPSLGVYWKHCRINGLRALLRQMLRPPKARLEFDHARALAARGVPTIQALGWGVRRQWLPSDSYLLTQARPLAVPLEQFLATVVTASARVRQAVARAIGEFLGRLHENGVCHPDLHPGNILAELDAAGQPQFCLIDLHAVTVGPALSVLAGRDNLVFLNRWFALRASRTDRLRCWRAYCQVRQLPRPMRVQTALALEQATRASNQHLWAGRASRCLHASRHFQRVRSATVQGFAVRDVDVSSLLADPDALFRAADAVLLKDGRSSTVAALTWAGRRVVVKRFLVTHWSERWLNCVRRSPALRAWVAGHALLDRLLPTPRPLVVLHRLHGGLPAEGYLLCEEVPNAVALADAMRTAAQRREHCAQAGRLLRLLHERGASHRDLKAANVLVNADGLHLIDLVGVTLPGQVSRARCVRDLARLNASFPPGSAVSRTDKLQFLRAYLNWHLHPHVDWPDWWQAIAQATARKQARNARRGRPLA